MADVIKGKKQQHVLIFVSIFQSNLSLSADHIISNSEDFIKCEKC